ncbi:hypothetical protein K504DRAFT_466175 [Pleomassaria siparia CBS 279.74]|uniref:Chromatin modification-related protein n=1 Tax=Pleomassaria siparia CBS 279.74 TaxID=1314801 RepID=A0A6G1KF28_9PLEO|nr:hypothetical protein K504DRAFT_466175 [Pleomassaria siparia CBS 279.74]
MATELDPQPAPNPDAQNTVNDFLDYCEYFPSDLLRSLRLIGDLDNKYIDATQTVHELAKTYGRLPDIPANERPDPIALRKEIAAKIDKAIRCRESTYAEATRLYEVAERNTHRLAIIKRKLQALPQPPSRDPTPVPVSPQATRPINRSYEKAPRLHLHFDGSRHATHASAPRARDRSRKTTVPLPRASRFHSVSSSDAESDAGRPKNQKNSRARTPGRVGTNVHSSIAGISTSNALARLSPPPADSKPGSRFAPWFELTEYEMAVLRKQMKKNAIWRPSDTMIRRELDRKGRGHSFFNKEKARCEAAGEEMLNEPLDAPPPIQKTATPKAATPPPATLPEAAPAEEREVEMPDADADIEIPTEPAADGQLEVGEEAAISEAEPDVDAIPVPTLAATPALIPVTVAVPVPVPVAAPSPPEVTRNSIKDDTATVNTGMRLSQAKEAKKVKRESQRVQAMRDAQGLEDATRKIKEAAASLAELDFGVENITSVTPVASKKRSTARASNKRKRDASPVPANETPTATTREPSLASQDGSSKPPDRKRPRLQPIVPAPTSVPSLAATPTVVVTPQDTTPGPPSSVVPTPVTRSPSARATTLASPALLSPIVPSPAAPPAAKESTPAPTEPTAATTIQIPLAPAGPSTPNLDTKAPSNAPSQRVTPALPSPAEAEKSPTFPASAQPTATAASSRPRRETVAPKTSSPPLPATPAQPDEPIEAKLWKTPPPVPEAAPTAALASRPRSARGHVPTPKAQSEEPKPHDAAGRLARELRRHSIFSQSAIAAPTRMSTRKKPPPKGDITMSESGQKTVTNVKRAEGGRNSRKKKGGGGPETLEGEEIEEVDPNEPRYCDCNEHSWGEMISCDNECEKEWFHLSCVNLKKSEIPSRRGLWYCPDCRAEKGTDQYGNKPVPPTLPGRRGNRSV